MSFRFFSLPFCCDKTLYEKTISRRTPSHCERQENAMRKDWIPLRPHVSGSFDALIEGCIKIRTFGKESVYYISKYC